MLRTMKWIFIVLCLYLASLFFRQERIPSDLCESLAARFLPTNLVFCCESVSFGFTRGVDIRGIKLYDTAKADPLTPLASADSVSVDPIRLTVRIESASYPRLPDSYYAPGNKSVDRGAGGLKFDLPDLPDFRLVLIRPDILAIRPEKVECDVEFSRRKVEFSRVRVVWPNAERDLALDGNCMIDLEEAVLKSWVKGLATQAYIRPFIDTLDVPIALEYMDAFTDITEPVKAHGTFDVNLRNNDFSMMLDLHPVMGSYNKVPMKNADGKLYLFVYTRNDRLNYSVKVGDLRASDPEGRFLGGNLAVKGAGDLLTVDIDAKSELPIQHLVMIAGFPDVDVGHRIGTVTGTAHLEMYEPDTSDMRRLNGRGHIEVDKGHLSQMKLFMGLTDHLAERVPGIANVVNQSQASVDFSITNGVFQSDNISISGDVFTLAMKGRYDIVKDELDFTARVKLLKDENILGRYLIRPVTWTFSKLLLEFRLKGTADNPRWEYVSVIDRMMEAIK